MLDIDFVDEILNTTEACKFLKVSHSTMKNYLRQGKIKAFTTPGGHYRIYRKDIDDFIEQSNKKGYKKIIVVDDDLDILELMDTVLHTEKYNVITVCDAVKLGIKVITEKPDLILLDIMMPSIDGYEVCRSLKEDDITKNIPIILVTGIDLKAVKNNYIKVGADSYLLKPFTPEQLLDKIREYV
ncbi:MAG: response regulator [Candidatus Muirbacterium halophilum]|nr:response regulator [Candidatus Muirbacterium halophilum]MCK9475837.1 response regulator [Candidatus Muirbacterium halophilum]